MPLLLGNAGVWLLEHWRLLLAIAAALVIWWQDGVIDSERARVADKSRMIGVLEQTIADRDALAREISRQAAEREIRVRQALAEATAKAAGRERVIADLRARRPQTEDACADAKELLRLYREAQ